MEPVRVTITSSLNMRVFTFPFYFLFELPEHWVPVHIRGFVRETKLDIFGEGKNLFLKFLLL